MHSFLLMGQSNMAGRGVLTDADRIYDPRIFKLVNGRWQTAWEPLSSDRVFAGASLAPSFALEYLAATGAKRVGLIPAADGGSSIDKWQPGEALYDNAVNAARLAKRISQIDAVLWHQGEADCNPDRAAVYAEKFLRMFRQLKEDLEQPSLKIYVGGLGDYLPMCPHDPNLAHYAALNAVLRELAASYDDIVYIDASGLTPKEDNLHFNTASLREFGRRYFAAFAASEPERVRTEKPFAAECSDSDTAQTDSRERLAQMKQRLENGEISEKEYDTFVKAFISEL